MKKCAKCKHLYGRFGAWVGCELTNKEIKHPYLSKCQNYESYKKIKISKNSYGDTRHAPKDTTFKQFHKANVEHIEDVKSVMKWLGKMLIANGKKHDYTKIKYEKEFFDNFKDTLLNGKDFVSNTWYQKHVEMEKHHPFSNCHSDITLLDIIETIVDCVCAGKSRGGEIRQLEFNEKIVELAINNTIKMIDNLTYIKGAF